MEDHRWSVLVDCGDDRGGVAEIDRDHLDAVSGGCEVRIRAGTTLAFYANNLDATSNEILSKVRTVLAADPCNECLTVGHPAIVPSEALFNDASALT